MPTGSNLLCLSTRTQRTNSDSDWQERIAKLRADRGQGKRKSSLSLSDFFGFFRKADLLVCFFCFFAGASKSRSSAV